MLESSPRLQQLAARLDAAACMLRFTSHCQDFQRLAYLDAYSIFVDLLNFGTSWLSAAAKESVTEIAQRAKKIRHLAVHQMKVPDDEDT